jgi:hypothetical protein
MRWRWLLAVLIVASTAGFVVGTTLERHHSHNESAATLKAEGARASPTEGKAPREHAGESAEHRRAEGHPKGAESTATHASEGARTEAHAELKPLGVDIEAVPFVALAALISLGLAAGAWFRPQSLRLLLFIALAMLAFTALDGREVFHQNDEHQTGLAVLAGVVAGLHLLAAVVAAALAGEAASSGRGGGGPAAAMEG